MDENKTDKMLWTEGNEKLFRRVGTLLHEVDRMSKAMRKVEQDFAEARHEVQQSVRKAQQEAMKMNKVTKKIVNLRIKVANVIDEAVNIDNLIDKPMTPDDWPAPKDVDKPATG